MQMETDPKAIAQILSQLRGQQDEAEQLSSLAERLGPNWQKVSRLGAIPQGEKAVLQMLRSRLQRLQDDARQRLESALKGVDTSSVKPDLHPAKVQAARAQAAYLATARTSQLKPIAYLAVSQPIALPYLATTGVQMHPGKIQAARAQAAYLATARTVRSPYLGGLVPYLATAATSLHPMKVQAARSQAAYLATARTAKPASIGAAAYLATSSTQLHAGKVRAARVQAAYLGATRTAVANLSPSAYLSSKIDLHPGKIQAARAQAAYLATARSVKASGQPSPPEISRGGGEAETAIPKRGEIPTEARTKINDLVRLQKAIKALDNI
jgi:hypothetical protein